MKTEMKEKVLQVQEGMAEAHQHALKPLFERNSDWGPVPYRSLPLEGTKWRHFFKPSENSTGLHALGHAVLIEPDMSEFEGSLIELPAEELDKIMMNQTVGKIVEIGPSAWMDEPVPRAFPGELVIISKFAGAVVVGRDGRPYRMVNADDVYCRREGQWPNRLVSSKPAVLPRREKKEREHE